MNSRSKYPNSARGYTTSSQEDEELEVGEPIPEEEGAPGAKKIAGVNGKFKGRSGKPAEEDNGYHVPAPKEGEGRMALATAKYLQKNTDPEIERENQKIQRKEKEQRQSSNGDPSLEKNVFNSGVLGGAAAMGVAVVWFLIGLMNDYLFFYPPILFVVGLGALFKGLMGGNSEE